MGKNEIVLTPTYWASVSGGKDSLYMLKLILENPQLYKLTGVVHFELEIDYPFIKNVINYMEKECTKRGIKFVRIKPRKTWLELYNKWGFPDRKVRWCNSDYKLDAKKQLSEYMKSLGHYVKYYIGYCYDEIERYYGNENDIFPLVDFKVSENTIWEWAKQVSLFNDYYKYNRRCGCMFCPMGTRAEMAYLCKYYPNEYEKMIKMMKKTEYQKSEKLGKKFCITSSNPKYDAFYIDNIVKTKWLPKLNAKEC